MRTTKDRFIIPGDLSVTFDCDLIPIPDSGFPGAKTFLGPVLCAHSREEAGEFSTALELFKPELFFIWVGLGFIG